jgi:hypothetical protein
MYAPDTGSRLYLIAHQITGVLLEPIVAALDKLPNPTVAEPWNGESAPLTPYFMSPGRLAKMVVSKARKQKLHESTVESGPAKMLAEIRLGWNVVGRRNTANKPI